MLRTLLIAVFGLLLVLTPALAQEPPKTPRGPSVAPPKMKPIWDYEKELGLSNEQSSKLRNAANELKQKLEMLAAKGRVTELELRNLMEKDADLSVIRTKLIELHTIQVDMQVADMEAFRKVRKVLTQDQISKWAAIQKKQRDTAGN